MSKLLIVGAGGHGQVLAETASEVGNWSNIAFLDDRFPLEPVLSYSVVGRISEAYFLEKEYSHIIVAIGNNHRRMQLLKEMKNLKYEIPIIIHPTAFISKYAALGKGTVILAKAVVNVSSTIGQGCIINTAATVDHDCKIADGVHISPGVNLAGHVSIGKNSWIGIGAVVIEQVSIGSDVIIGAGSVVIKNTDDSVTLVGVPARVIEHH